MEPFDVAVIGAGFGGLGAALSAAERGARVVLCEALNYPGGCASTFTRAGLRFEAGATLFSGLGEDQLFGAWARRHQIPLQVDWLDPLVELRAEGLRLAVRRDRQQLIDRLADLPGAPAPAVRAFFAEQRRVADTLWALFDEPDLLPPLSPRALLRHLARTPRYLRLVPLLGRPLGALLERGGLASFAPLRTFLDAACQITVQCAAAEAEAPFAFAAVDYFWRGTGHVRGGIGELAWGLCRAFERQGGLLRLSDRVRGLRRDGAHWLLETRRGPLRARAVVANLLPGDLRGLLGELPGARPPLDALAERVAEGYGAVMLYLTARPPDGDDGQPHHLQLISDARAPLERGNHLFVSSSGEADAGRAPAGLRTLTCSTHLRLGELRSLDEEGRARLVEQVQAQMGATLQQRAPEWAAGIAGRLTASPRTFARFTRRSEGAVGGIPRRAGLVHYRQLGPLELDRGLWLVGDSAFPGQSTYATALGGVRVAAAIAKGSG